MKRSVLVVFLVLILVSANLFANGDKETKENKVLRLLTWSGYAPDELIQKFEAETGYKVEITYTSNEEMISKLRATRGGGYDLAEPSFDRVPAVAEQYGIYQPIDYSRVDLDQIEPNMLAAVKKTTMVNGKSYGVPHVSGTNGMIVNKALAPDVKDFKDLLDLKYKGRISYRMKRPVIIAMGYSLGYTPIEDYNDKVKYQEFLDGIEKALIAAKPAVRNYWDNGDALIESMRSGEVWAAMAWEQQGARLYKENPDIDYVAASSGVIGWIDCFALPSKSENLDAAYAWINFSLRPENAAVLTNTVNYMTASKDAGQYYEDEPKANFKRWFPPEVLAKIHWHQAVPAGIEEMEGKTMDRIRAAK